MKAKQFILLLLLALVSCQTMTFEDIEEGNNNPSKGSKTMYFRLTGFSMNNIDELPTEEGEDTRASSIPQGATDHLILGIYNSNRQLIDTLHHQQKEDETIKYGTFSHTLEYGKYTILAMGWNGTQQCLVHSLDSITFSEGWVPNTFLCRQNIIVSESYSDTRTLSMKRCVARFRLKFTDTTIPQNLSKFVFNISGAGNTLDSETRHSTSKTDFSRTIPVSIDPAKLTDISAYCFLPEDSTSIDITVTAYNAEEEVIASKAFANVPVKINYSTNYTGAFFPIGTMTGNIIFETDFDGEFNNAF